MRLRSMLATVALLTLAAPAATATANCAVLLRDYARVAKAFPEWRSNTIGVNRNTARVAQRVLAAGCVTRLNDLVALDALSAELRGTVQGDRGTVGEPRWLQAGVVPGLLAETEARRFFASLGMQSRGRGAAGLGRWVLVGPYRTEAGLAEAAAIARRAGFPAPLPRPYR